MLEQFDEKYRSTAPLIPPTTVGLFAGIGGLELGLQAAGYATALLCENAPPARAVLAAQFAGTGEIAEDVLTLEGLPRAEVVTAGFPCTDLSQAGRLAGINGPQSGLVARVFDLLRAGPAPRWLLLENVPFLLQLEHGAGMRYLVEQLECLGFQWAYRVVDTRAFGLPQRRRRVLIVASRDEDPSAVLFADDAEHRPEPDVWQLGGFYWTEGNRGLGWIREAVPPLKGSSGLGIPSAPAIWDRDADAFFTPDIRDAERLQGFPVDWTKPGGTLGARWKLVGNAVSVPVAAWLGGRLATPDVGYVLSEHELNEQDRWPRAGRGAHGRRFAVEVSEWPVANTTLPLNGFLQFERHPLSWRAASGFLRRAQASRLKFEPGFLNSLTAYVERSAPRRAAVDAAGG